MLGKLGSIEDVATLVPAIRDLIVRTLEQTIKVDRYETGVWPSPTQREFVGLLGELRTQRSVGVITFNYDIGLDFALHHGTQRFSYELSSSDTGEMPLLKLHGSVNWVSCMKCNGVWALPVATLTRGLCVPNREMHTVIPVSDTVRRTRMCNCGASYHALIVPPSWSKATYWKAIAAVWRAAARELCEAEYIIPIGYSLPSSDAFFRQLYALGAVGQNPLKGFWVVNPDTTVEERFRSLLGPGAAQRFKMFPLSFSAATKQLAKELHRR
jgi:hypothetical protein